MKSYRLFNYLKELVLTKEGYSRLHWELPKCLIGKNTSYHKESSYKKDYFQSVMCGQEFVVDAAEDIIGWLKEVLQLSIK